MHINYPLISRILIALLFVVAGIQKLFLFTPEGIKLGISQFAGYMQTLGFPMPMLFATLVILVEIPVALAYAYGYKVKYTGGALAIFTLLAIAVAHRDFSVPMNVVMALKNLAIVGGILATTGICSCDRCSAVEGKA